MIEIKKIGEQDLCECLNLYNYYVENSFFTFEEQTLSFEAFSKRIYSICEKYFCLVASQDNKVLGYAYLNEFSPRSAYRFSADLSIYVQKDCVRSGIGSKLLDAVLVEAKKFGIKNIISVVSDLNENSLRFHQKNGFIQMGSLPNIGFKFNRWLGIKYLMKTLD